MLNMHIISIIHIFTHKYIYKSPSRHKPLSPICLTIPHINYNCYMRNHGTYVSRATIYIHEKTYNPTNPKQKGLFNLFTLVPPSNLIPNTL